HDEHSGVLGNRDGNFDDDVDEEIDIGRPDRHVSDTTEQCRFPNSHKHV
ncbi:hypothetical protein Tco_0673256, partial [Tanacetum coccineum]